MKATTGLAWWAGTGSSGGSSGTAEEDVKVDVAVKVKDSVEVSMHNHKAVGSEHDVE